MLTLTQRNVTGEMLPDEITHILAAWKLLTQRQEFKPVAGWLRTLEVTRNDQTKEWHPHLHALLWVKSEYWQGHNYISQKKWRELWADVMGLDYDPSINVHVIKPRSQAKDSTVQFDQLDNAAMEVGKYTVKDSDLIGDKADDTVERVEVLDKALKGRRLLAWGGRLKDLAKEILKPETEGREDLIHVTGEEHGMDCPICGTTMKRHLYRWMNSLRNYVG
jgi:hypothetical protein